ITARFKHRQARLYGGAIEHDVLRVEQLAKGGGNVGAGGFIATAQNPDQLTKRVQTHGHDFGLLHHLNCRLALLGVIPDDGAQQDVGVDDDLHASPAPAAALASAIASSISSMVSTLPLVLPFRNPASSRNVPSCRVAFNSARPSGSKFSSILCPGLM